MLQNATGCLQTIYYFKSIMDFCHGEVQLEVVFDCYYNSPRGPSLWLHHKFIIMRSWSSRFGTRRLANGCNGTRICSLLPSYHLKLGLLSQPSHVIHHLACQHPGTYYCIVYIGRGYSSKSPWRSKLSPKTNICTATYGYPS